MRVLRSLKQFMQQNNEYLDLESLKKLYQISKELVEITKAKQFVIDELTKEKDDIIGQSESKFHKIENLMKDKFRNSKLGKLVSIIPFDRWDIQNDVRILSRMIPINIERVKVPTKFSKDPYYSYRGTFIFSSKYGFKQQSTSAIENEAYFFNSDNGKWIGDLFSKTGFRKKQVNFLDFGKLYRSKNVRKEALNLWLRIIKSKILFQNFDFKQHVKKGLIYELDSQLPILGKVGYDPNSSKLCNFDVENPKNIAKWIDNYEALIPAFDKGYDLIQKKSSPVLDLLKELKDFIEPFKVLQAIQKVKE